MEPGAHTTYAAWLLRPGADPLDDGLSLRVTLLANDRDHHGTTSIGGFDPDIRVAGESLMVANAGLFSLTIRASGGEVVPKRDWYRNFDLPVEAERGLEFDRQSSVRRRGNDATYPWTMVWHRCEPRIRAVG